MSRVDLPRPTGHRLLTGRREEGLVERDESTAAWHVGPECFFLGTAAAARHDVPPIARETVRRIARKTGRARSSP